MSPSEQIEMVRVSLEILRALNDREITKEHAAILLERLGSGLKP